MKFNTENFLINNAVLYLSKYILLNNDFQSFTIYNFNQNLNQLYYNKKYFCNALDYFIKNDFVENIVFKVETVLDDKINEVFINKDSKNYELPDGKIILKTQKYFNDYLNENIYYYPSITFNKINKNKLINFINEYLNLWLDNNVKLDNKMFYKKEKQLELVVGYIKELLLEYNSKDLLINLERLYNSTYIISMIGMGKIEDYQVDVLITLIYLEIREIIKIKEFRLGNSFEDIKLLIDIDEEKINGDLRINDKKETSIKTKITDEILNELNKIDYEIKNSNHIGYSNSYEYIGLKIYNIYYKIVDKTETLLLSKNFYNSKDSLLKKINILIEYKLIDKALLNDFLVFIRVKEFYDNKAGISNLFEENALKCGVKIILILEKIINDDNQGLEKEDDEKITNELIFDGINLIFGDKNKELNGYQLKFAEFIFEIDKGIIKHKWNDCEEHIYGKNGSTPNTGLSGIIKKINIHLKNIGCNKTFSYSDNNYILLKNI